MKCCVNPLTVLIALGTVICLSACYDQTESGRASIQMNGFGTKNLKSSRIYQFEDLKITRMNWDDFQVTYKSIQSGKTKPVKADDILISVQDQNGNELHRTSKTTFSFADENFSSEEEFSIQCCAWIGSQKICEKQKFKSSKKRMSFTAELQYPVEKSIYLGNYQIVPKIYRVKSDFNDQEELITGGQRTTYAMSVYTSDQQQTKLRLELDSVSGAFNLMNSREYSELKEVIESEISEKSGSLLNFDLTSNWDSDTTIHQIQKMIGNYKSISNPNSVNQFASAAAHSLMKLVEPNSGYQSRATIRNWSFEEKSNQYKIHFNVQWKSEWYVDETMKVKGTLYVKPGGKNATFKYTYANDPVRDLEESRGQRLFSTLQLGDIKS